MTKGACIVETRDLPDLIDVIDRHLTFLPPDWGLTIFCSSLNHTRLFTHFPGANFIILPVQLDIPAYNKLLTTSSFWLNIPYDKILIFQIDSILLRPGIEKFLEWDYVGAPWKFQNHGGNGGLSLRTRQVMLSIINSLDYQGGYYGNEDIYFCNQMLGTDYKLAPREVCSEFSCESIFQLGTLGIHAIDKYLTQQEITQIKTQYDNQREVSPISPATIGH